MTEVKYATEWYSESQGQLLLSPATKKRYGDQVEADMPEMPSMSKSEIMDLIQGSWPAWFGLKKRSF